MRALISVCFTLVLPAPSFAATFDRDDRIAVTRPDASFLPIGVVKGGKRVAHATGFLVSDCHVLTVKHAAGRVGNVVGRRMTFRLPFAGRDERAPDKSSRRVSLTSSPTPTASIAARTGCCCGSIAASARDSVPCRSAARSTHRGRRRIDP